MIISGWGPRAAPANGEAKPVEGGMRGVCAPDSARPTSGARGVRSDPERSAKVYARAPRSPPGSLGEFPTLLSKVALRFGLADLLSGMR